MSILQQLKNRMILQGDVLEKLDVLPTECIDCVITSPPYWGLRDYGVPGQWGLEPDFHEYLEKMQQFMRGIKRVLKDTGSVWINLGDTYSGGVTHSDFAGLPKELARPWNEDHRFRTNQKKNHIQAKSQYGIPQRFYADCIDDDWVARNFIPWVKENPMPSSVKDRFTNKWEPVMFFAKQQQYYFDLDAVRVKSITESKPFNIRVRDNISGKAQQKLGARTWTASEEEMKNYDNKGIRKQDNTMGAAGKPLTNYKGFNERWSEKTRKHYDEDGNCLGCGRPASQHTVTNRAQGSENRDARQKDEIVWCNPKGKNPGDIFKTEPTDVWKSGSGFDSNGNCFGCGEHFTKHSSGHDKNLGRGTTADYTPCNPRGKNPGDIFKINPRPFSEAHFATFPIDLPLKILKCACPPNGFVLDPFLGSGTVGQAAELLGLNWIGIELNQKYINIIKKRLEPYLNERLEAF